MIEFSDYVMARKGVSETLDWLQKELLISVQTRLNDADVRARLGLYGGEAIPTNERNLTDTRNRVSLIYEYLLADRISETLAANGSEEFCAYVVANRFPDLEIRDHSGARGLRLEVKCLQSTAEEKSANFSTLLKDVHPTSDYLIVFLWEWGWDSAEINWDRAPIISEIFAFNAYALAQLRDWYWLNRPANNQGDAYQGYDLRGAITANAGSYKEEEGNYGKLLRIWDAGFAPKPQMDSLLERTERDYARFRHVSLHAGFESLSKTILLSVVSEHEIQPVEHKGSPIGYRRGSHWFVLSSKISPQELVVLMKENGANDVIMFNDKYQWKHCRLQGTRFLPLNGNGKPKHLGNYLNTDYLSHLDEGLPLSGTA